MSRGDRQVPAARLIFMQDQPQLDGPLLSDYINDSQVSYPDGSTWIARSI